MFLRDGGPSFSIAPLQSIRHERTRQALLCGSFVVLAEYMKGQLLLLGQPLFQIAFLVGAKLDAIVDLVDRALERAL